MAGPFQFGQVLGEDDLAATHLAVRSAAKFEMLVNKPSEGFAAGMVSRADAANEFLRTGGLSGRPVNLLNLADRVNFFRATFAYGAKPSLAGIEPFLASERFAEAARSLYDRPIVEPAIVFANAALPDQEIGVHTDVPEFRGFDRDCAPEWLLVVMHLSGLFAAERVPIATGIAWFGDACGGALWHWPDGPEAAPKVVEIADNRGILFDTDSVFHAVAPVRWTRGSARPAVEIGATLAWDHARDCWVVRFRGAELTTLAAQDVRISISWKARCFADEHERAQVQAGADGLTLIEVLTRLRRDLADRGQLPSAEVELSETELAMVMIDEYVRFPTY
jgi:hypothetical protein